MDKKKAIDLIKLEVLSSIKKEDAENLKIAKETDENFPFKELGDYQNLVASLPLVLPTEYPSSELKDKTALKLYSIRDEIKAKLDAKKALEEPEEVVPEEEPELEETVEEELSTSEDYSLRTVEQSDTEILEQTKRKEVVEEEPSRIEPKPRDFKDKEQIEKTVRDSVKVYLENEIQPLKEAVKKNMMMSIVFFALSLILIVLVFVLK
jgi:hypothetical protein